LNGHPLCADIDGFSLHAKVRCGADDRHALEQLCRNITRPVLANKRVQTDATGPVVLKLQDSLARRHQAFGHESAGVHAAAGAGGAQAEAALEQLARLPPAASFSSWPSTDAQPPQANDHCGLLATVRHANRRPSSWHVETLAVLTLPLRMLPT
jgi:hypothetical protein